MDMEARERIPRVQQQPSLPRREAQDEETPADEATLPDSQWEDSSGTGVETPCTGGKTAAKTTNQSEHSIPNSPSAGDARRESDIEDEERINPTLSTKYVDQPERNTGWIVTRNGDLQTQIGSLTYPRTNHGRKAGNMMVKNVNHQKKTGP